MEHLHFIDIINDVHRRVSHDRDATKEGKMKISRKSKLPKKKFFPFTLFGDTIESHFGIKI